MLMWEMIAITMTVAATMRCLQ